MTQTKAEKPKTAPAPAPSPVFTPSPVTPDDFFRLRRKEGGWIVEMVRVDKAGKVMFRRDVWEWDLVSAVETRLLSLASEAEVRR